MLIGENSSGKSSVLQAIDILCSLASRDIPEYLRERGWAFEDIKSQFAKDDEPISFVAEFDLTSVNLVWSISINKLDDEWDINEQIRDIDFGQIYSSDHSSLKIVSSILKVDEKLIEDFPILRELKGYLLASNSFELLSPERMRKGSRGNVEDIGIGGEKLSAYIHLMSSKKKSDLSQLVSKFLGYDVKISTSTKGQPGWVEMYVDETWHEDTPNSTGIRKIKKEMISDGLLRIVALSAIIIGNESKKELANAKPQGLILLDEIEDGINPNISELLIDGFRDLIDRTSKQIVITSHSPVFVNHLSEDEIQYMWRDENTGDILVKPLFDTEQMKDMLDFLNPGEVWLNYSKEAIISNLMSSNSVVKK
jgi:predicted ATP-binding protein involved in virulence